MRSLICIPTALEQSLLALPTSHAMLVCGFGLINSGIALSRALCQERFSQVILIGCAGSFDLKRCPVGSAHFTSQILLDGIGVGSGAQFKSLKTLGWGEDRIQISPEGVTTLSVTSASGSAEDAALRKQRYPEAVLEEMEGFAVSVAAKSAGVACRMLRGVSNPVGVRTDWKIKEALAAVRELLLKTL